MSPLRPAHPQATSSSRPSSACWSILQPQRPRPTRARPPQPAHHRYYHRPRLTTAPSLSSQGHVGPGADDIAQHSPVSQEPEGLTLAEALQKRDQRRSAAVPRSVWGLGSRADPGFKHLRLRCEMTIDQLHPGHHCGIARGCRGCWCTLSGSLIRFGMAAQSVVTRARSHGNPRRESFTCSWARRLRAGLRPARQATLSPVGQASFGPASPGFRAPGHDTRISANCLYGFERVMW